ncbi:MAG: hypothetical protein H0X62_02030 [Bacteroidetes bacterium]|nr:hypothetical protein [Bacteroidota bacterium]
MEFLEYPTGKKIRKIRESRITMRVMFIDGNPKTIRSDDVKEDGKFATANIQLKHLVKDKLKVYLNKKRVVWATIFDNELSEENKRIFMFKNGEVTINMLSLYDPYEYRTYKFNASGHIICTYDTHQNHLPRN